MADDPPPPHALQYRSSAADRPTPPGNHDEAVARGFLTGVVAGAVLLIAVLWGGLRGDDLGLAAAAVVAVVVGMGVYRGGRRGEWGFLGGIGLFVGLVGALLVVVRLALR